MDTYNGVELEQILQGGLPSNFEMSEQISNSDLEEGRATMSTRKIHSVIFFVPQSRQ